MPAGGQDNRILRSWKEVADYLGVTPRTAQKWETERNLPIHRATGARGHIYADSGELENWREAAFPISRNGLHDSFFRLRKRHVVIGGGVVALLLLCLWGWNQLHGPIEPFSYRIERFALVVNDGNGREVWRQLFPQPLAEAGYALRPDCIKVLDVDGDGHKEVLFIHMPATITQEGYPLICYDFRGKMRWRFVPGAEVRSATEEFPQPYRVWAFAPVRMRRAGEFALAVTSLHHSMYPTQVALLSARDGRKLKEYWHSGYLDQILVADFDRDGEEEILLGGCNNAYNAATLIALDPGTMGGASVEEFPQNRLIGFAPGTEKVRLLFPRSCMNQRFARRNWVERITTDQKGLIVIVGEQKVSDMLVGTSFYRFDRNFEIVNCQFEDNFRARHSELEASGLLDHQLSPAEEQDLRKIRRLR